jgi:hypothetical protein
VLLEVNDVRLVIARVSGLADESEWRKITQGHSVLAYVSDVQQFNAWYDALGDVLTVLFWDTEAANEVAHNIRLGMETFDVQPFQTVYATFDARDLPEAIQTRVGTVLIGGAFHGVLADLYFDQVAEFATTLSQRRRGQDRGYIGEVFATMLGATASWNGTGILMSGTGILSASPVVDRTLASELVVGILGRYFPPREARFAKHQFSRRLLAAKSCDPRARPLLEPLGFGLRSLAHRLKSDVLTRIPPKPSSEYDHVGWLLREAAARDDVRLAERVHLDVLECRTDYAHQRHSGSHEQRAANVANVFRARNVRGRRILLVDDIITSGSTVASAAKTLLEAGAAAVGILVLGYNQNQIHRLTDSVLPCPAEGCGGAMTLQLSRKSDAGFWGCTNWKTGCKKLMYFRNGLLALNALNSRDSIQTVPDIGF